MPAEPAIAELTMTRVFPTPAEQVPLSQALAFPADQPEWLRAVFVASTDGATTVGGRVGILGNDTDKQLFSMHRAMPDLVLVGAGTARAEQYGPVEHEPLWDHLRQGRSRTAPMAVVSHDLAFDFTTALFTEAPLDAPTIVITRSQTNPDRLRQAREVTEVIVTGDEQVDLTSAVAELRRRGYGQISCEGGPRLFADLLRAGLVDELCLTRAPLLVAGQEVSLLRGDSLVPAVRLSLVQLHTTPDGYLYQLMRVA